MSSKVFQEYYSQLVNSLPMHDAVFRAKLFEKGLLPGDSKERVESLATKADKATFFLDNMIKPSVQISNIGDSFKRLLDVMEDCGFEDVKT